MPPDNQEACANALNLGWRLAELYHQASFAMPAVLAPDAPPPAHLPGFGEMSPGEKGVAILNHIVQCVGVLPGVTIEQSNTAAVIQANIRTSRSRADILQSIRGLYIDIRNGLAGTEPDLATAFGLGRMLADTCLLPTSNDWASYQQQFDIHRLRNAYDWLAELSAKLPPKTTAVVADSLRIWAAWVGDPAFVSRRDNRALKGSPNLAADEATTRALRRQGEQWRRLLVGEQDPDALLSPDDYVHAGVRMLDRIKTIGGRFLRRWWLPIAVTAAALIGGFFVLVSYAPSGSGKVAAIVASLLGALGVTWKGLSSTLGRVVSEAQKPLWDAELSAALTIAATCLPSRAKPPN